MAIHDIDRIGPDRGNPNPNTHDTSYVSGAPIINQPRQSHGTTSINPSTDASPAGFISTRTQNIIANDGTTNKALMGYNSAIGKWGLFVAKDGIDVTKNTDSSQFIFNSGQDALKIVQTGTTSITVPAVTGSTIFSVSVAHGLGYAPIPLVYISDGTYFYPTPFHQGMSASGLFVGTNLIITSFVDNNNLFVSATVGQNAGNPSANGTFPIKYYLLQETAS